MKHLFHFGLPAIILLCTISSHAQQEQKGAVQVKQTEGKEKSRGKESLSIRGAYAMYRQVANNGTRDSMMANEQMKLFTDKYVMYAHKRPNDSLAEFGVGTYKIQNGKVIEHMFYTAAGGAHKDTFELMISKKDDGYTQIINFPGEQGDWTKLTEDYKTIGTNATSPLDGAWKQIKNIYVPKNRDAITDDNPTQYKLYQSGHFIWGNTILDSATRKPASYFGYGTFKMNGANQATEVNSSSSYATTLEGTPVTLDLQFTDKDHYRQTIELPDGSKFVEYYERMK